MTHDVPRWDRQWELFHAALERSPEKRPAYLAEACGGDAALHECLAVLLASHDQVGSFLQPSDVEVTADRPTQDLPAGRSAPDRIGRYEIRRLIASGGMGTVYEAVQDHPHRLVALKVLRRGAASPQAMKRFKHEAEILGHLRHPNIAQIYDAGTFDEGEGVQPFFAMELVRGQPLVEYCDAKKLGTRPRLELFCRVCDAVQYAHHQGVIHRDLKPDNVLVDDAGEPKILDFGVARATGADIQTTTLQTDIGQLIGTVPYMSPEQVSGDPHAIDMRSDVYTLGVILYQLLCGRLPHDLRDKSIPEAARVIREQEPTPLSSIDRSLRGDLETIVAKTLEKERDRRYQSPAVLAADIRHHLADEPIVARPASTFYQLQKFARRNKTLVGGVAASFALLLAGTAGIAWQWQAARSEAARATEINDYLMRLFALVNPYEGVDALAMPGSMERLPSVENLIDDAAAGLATSFAKWPDVRADLHGRLGKTYFGLSRFEEASRHLDRAYTILGDTVGREHPDALVALMWRGLAETLRPDVNDAKLAAESDLQQATDGLRQQFGPADRQTLMAEMWLAGAVCTNGRVEGTAQLWDVLDKCRETFGPDDRLSLFVVALLGEVLNTQGLPAEAETLLVDGLALSRRALADDDMVTITIANQLAGTLSGQRRHEEALELARFAYAQAHRDGRPGVSQLFIRTSLGLAEALMSVKRYEEAEQVIREKLEACERHLGDHGFTLWMIERVGSWLYRQGRYADAEGILRAGVKRFARVLDDDDIHLAITRFALGSALEAQGRLSDAEVFYRHAVEGYRRATPSIRFLPGGLWQLARCLERQGKMNEAEGAWRERRDAYQETLGPEHRQTLSAVNVLAWFLKDRGEEKLLEAEDLAREGTSLARSSYGDEDALTIMIADTLAVVLGLRGDCEAAVSEFQPLAAAARKTDGDQWCTVMSCVPFGRCLTELRRFEEAESALRAAEASGNAAAREALVELYESWGKPEKAAAYRELRPASEGVKASD